MEISVLESTYLTLEVNGKMKSARRSLYWRQLGSRFETLRKLLE
jgi:hypothetical protein